MGAMVATMVGPEASMATVETEGVVVAHQAESMEAAGSLVVHLFRGSESLTMGHELTQRARSFECHALR